MQTPHRTTAHLAVPSDFDLSTLAANLGTGDLEQRLSALWIGTSCPIWDERDLSPLRAALLWEALPAFLAAEGWQIAATLPMERHDNELGRLSLRAIPHDDQRSLAAPLDVVVFAHRGSERLIVTFHHERNDWSVGLGGLTTSEDLARTWAGWAERAVCTSFLRGRVIAADGRRLLAHAAPTWSDVFLPDETIRAVREEVARLDRAITPAGRVLGLEPPRGLLLHGPRGSGKTLLARAIAAESARTTVWPKAEDVQRDARGVVQLARVFAPSLLILDDLETMTPDDGFFFGRSGLEELLRPLDPGLEDRANGASVVLVATTSSLEALETLLRGRPAYCERVIEIPPVTSEVAWRYVEARLARDLTDPERGAIGSALDGSSRGQLAAIVDTALGTALDGAADQTPAEGIDEKTSAIRARIGVEELLAAATEVRARCPRPGFSVEGPDEHGPSAGCWRPGSGRRKR